MSRLLAQAALLAALSALSTLARADAIPNCPAGRSTVASLVDVLMDNGPGTSGIDVWSPPTASQRDAFARGFDYLVRNEQGPARDWFMLAGMDVCRAQSIVSGPFDTWVVYDPAGLSAVTSNGRPVLVYANKATTAAGTNTARVVLSIPHAKTESQLADRLVVEAINGARDAASRPVIRAAVIGTVHRCHHDDALQGPYVGSVSVSGCNGVMRVSDEAHNPESLFQAMHEALRLAFWNDYVVSVHGAGSDFGGISVSNGSSEQYDGGTQDRHHAVVRWYDQLTLLAGSATDGFTTCHAYSAVPGRTRPADYFEERRCGTRNATRGEDPRLPSEQQSATRQYRFLHIEIDSELKDSNAERRLFVDSFARILQAN